MGEIIVHLRAVAQVLDAGLDDPCWNTQEVRRALQQWVLVLVIRLQGDVEELAA